MFCFAKKAKAWLISAIVLKTNLEKTPPKQSVKGNRPALSLFAKRVVVQVEVLGKPLSLDSMLICVGKKLVTASCIQVTSATEKD
jgi:hypothetical protein